jgi:hypothetical protein
MSVLNGHSLNTIQIKMKLNKIFLSFLILFTLTTKCYLQNIDYGLIIEANLASHTNSDPTKPEDGQFQWNGINTFGAGIYASKQVYNHIHLTSSLIFRQRGYTEEAQTGPIPSPTFSYLSLQNRFNYFSFDVKCKYIRNNSNQVKISPLFGFSANALVSKDIESERQDDINDLYPVNQYQDNWKRMNLNYVIGLSLFQLNKYSLDFEFNRSITPLLRLETLVVKDWIWSMKLNISIQKLLSPNHK